MPTLFILYLTTRPAQVSNPLSKAETASDYYDLGLSGPSGNPDFGPPAPEHGSCWVGGVAETQRLAIVVEGGNAN